jgi:hypothetical protein
MRLSSRRVHGAVETRAQAGGPDRDSTTSAAAETDRRE